MTIHSLDVADLAGTEDLGRRLGRLLFPGAIVALIGPLGTGKTHLVRAIAEGLGITDSRAVTSPTFVLIQEYDARLPIHHFDAYRLSGPEAFAALGVDEYFTAGGVCLIEWADRVEAALPADYLQITLSITGATSRHIDLQARGAAYADLVRKLSGPDNPLRDSSDG